MEQQSSKTKMAVAGGANVQLNECFVKLDFYLQPQSPEAQSRNLWAYFGECMVSTSNGILGL